MMFVRVAMYISHGYSTLACIYFVSYEIFLFIVLSFGLTEGIRMFYYLSLNYPSQLLFFLTKIIFIAFDISQFSNLI